MSSNPIPSSLSLSVISNGTLADATPVASNYASIQAAVNELITAFSGGAANQVLEAVDGTDVQWVNENLLKRYLVSNTNSSPVTTTGTTFAAGADVLPAALTFTADGSSNYLLSVIGESWHNSGTNQQLFRINLDGADYGAFGLFNSPGGGFETPLNAVGVVKAPSAGSHTINARLITGAGTATINAAAGGAVGGGTPILVAVQRAA